MEQTSVDYLKNCFGNLNSYFGFSIKTESNEGRFYLIEFGSENFVIEIEQYFREFIVSLYKTEKNEGINLFNLLGFLKSGADEHPNFLKEKNLENCFKIQSDYISTAIYENFDLIEDFFSVPNYKSRQAEFSKYWQDKHPEFYKRG